MDFQGFDTDQLIEWRGVARRNVRLLEKKGAMRTVQEDAALKASRAQFRQLGKEISKRIQQLRLF